MMPWIILERDGVINYDVGGCVTSVDEWHPLPGSVEAIVALSRAGFDVVIATNQSGVGRGVLRPKDLEEIHEALCSSVERAGGEIKGIFYCPHLPEDNCNCRKPRTGLLDTIEQEFGIELKGAIFVGDSLKDLKAARAKGCQPVLVRTGKGTQTETTTLLWPKYGVDTQIFDDLAEFAKSTLKNQKH